jgi:hypothetical protein
MNIFFVFFVHFVSIHGKNIVLNSDSLDMNCIRPKLELQIIIVKPNLIIKGPKRIRSVTLQRIAIPIIPGKFEIGMRSRSDLQNNLIVRIAPIHDPIRQKPSHKTTQVLQVVADVQNYCGAPICLPRLSGLTDVITLHSLSSFNLISLSVSLSLFLNEFMSGSQRERERQWKKER